MIIARGSKLKMPQRINGGVFDQQILTGSLSHWVISGADFSGAIDIHGRPVPNSAAEIIFKNIEEHATINIMNPNDVNLSFALEQGRSIWDEISLSIMVQSLGTDVGADHIDCTLCIVKQVPYIWGLGILGAFTDLSDVPSTYTGAENYMVTVNSGGTGLIFTPHESGTDYVPIPAGTLLSYSTKYFVTESGTVTLPAGFGSGKPAGTSVIIAKSTAATVFVNRFAAPDIISTDLGNDISIEFDISQECTFVFDGISTWNLQIGSRV